MELKECVKGIRQTSRGHGDQEPKVNVSDTLTYPAGGEQANRKADAVGVRS